MEGGDTFTKVGSEDKHLYIVLSDPKTDPGNVLLVNFTSLASWKDSACVLFRGDHPWICKDTCVNYEDAVLTTLTALETARDGGALSMRKPLESPVLQKVRDGALRSKRISLNNKKLLINQGLVNDC